MEAWRKCLTSVSTLNLCWATVNLGHFYKCHLVTVCTAVIPDVSAPFLHRGDPSSRLLHTGSLQIHRGTRVLHCALLPDSSACSVSEKSAGKSGVIIRLHSFLMLSFFLPSILKQWKLKMFFDYMAGMSLEGSLILLHFLTTPPRYTSQMYPQNAKKNTWIMVVYGHFVIYIMCDSQCICWT